MITDKFGKHIVERYGSIDEMPIVRFMMFNKYLLLDSGVGSDLEDMDRHDAKIIKFAKKGDYDRVVQEIQNRNQSIHMIMEVLNPKYMAYASGEIDRWKRTTRSL